MCRELKRLIVTIVLGLVCVVSAFAARTSQNTNGQTIEAELARIESSDAILRMHGRIYRVPISGLSEAD